MPSTVNGIGTMFHGKDEYESDGSYITTEWITVFWIPIIPIRSLRVRYIEEGERGLFTISSSRYETHPVKLYKKHIIKYYCLLICIILFIILLILASKSVHV